MNKDIQVITVCVNFSDIFEISIKNNKKYFENYTVVSDLKDVDTHSLCNKYNINLIKTDSFYKDGANFNKGRVLEETFDVFNRQGWFLLLDADIIIPNNFSLPNELNINNLYGIQRKMLRDIDKYHPNLDWKDIPEDANKEIIGYFQLFNGRSKFLTNRKNWYETDWIHDGGSDGEFLKLFPPENKVKIKGNVLHLGEDVKNWNGRCSKKTDGTFYPGSDITLCKQINMFKNRQTNRRNEKIKKEKF